MKEKKVSADWYIAATHWLTAFITGVIGAVILLILASLTGSSGLVAVSALLGWPIMLWLGVRYSARYLDKTYVIKNADHIIILSLIYLVIVGGGSRVYEFMQTGIIKTEYLGFVIAVIVFYFTSKRYVKNNDIPGVPSSSI